MNSIQKEQLLKEYCENEMEKLKRMCYPKICKIGGISQMDYDDLYSIALDVLRYSIDKYDDSKKCKFSTYLDGNITKKYATYIRDRNVLKRGGKVGENGEKIFKQEISIDASIEDGIDLSEKIASDFKIEDEVSEEIGFSFGENTEKYLSTLGSIQRQIANLIMRGYNSSGIKEKLNLTDTEYNTYFLDMKKYDKRKILKEDFEENEKICEIQEEKLMDCATVTSEKTKNTSYSIESICKKLKRKRLRDDHVLQRASGQWNLITKSELISDILQGKSLTQIIISEEIKNGITKHWLIDGKQRCTNINDFLNDGFAISKNVQIFNIPYQSDKLDEEENIICDEDGFAIPDEVQYFDIRNKKFSQLPEELQDKFKEYQVPVMLNLNCTKKDIAYDIARFNRCRPMNIAQNGWTGLDETFAEYVDNILKMDFFKIDSYKTSYTSSNDKSGALRRMVVEAIITSKYIDNYDKNFRKMCAYLTENASESVFIDFYTIIERLTSIAKPETAYLFNIKNSYLWLALFDKFTEMNIADEKFADFMCEFVKSLHSKAVNGITYDDLEENKNTKDKNAVKRKFSHLFTLMLDFLHINIEETQTKEENIVLENDSELEENKEISTLEFVKENVNPDVTEEDVRCYEEDLEILTLDVDNDSKLLDERNHSSLIAIITYSYANDITIDDWFIKYFEDNKLFMIDQKENYIHMKQSLEDYIREKGSEVA